MYVGQEQVLFTPSQGIAEIYKIHGCVTEPNSLILTSSDYENFNKKNPYLAAKLLTIFVEHPIIFLGYSLSDPNIQELLKQIASCLTEDNVKKLQDRLMFVQRDSESKGDSFESSILPIGDHLLPITIIRTNRFENIYTPLTKLRRRFNARLLRKMKEHIYELVKHNDPKGKLGVIDLSVADKFDDLEVVYGVGVLPQVGAAGYMPISRYDLLKDVMAETSHYDAKRLVADTLPGILRQAKYVPVFRYLREGGFIDSAGIIETKDLDARIKEAASINHDYFLPPQQYRNETHEVQSICRTISGVQLKYFMHPYYYIPLLKREQLNLDELRKYILANLNLISGKSQPNATYFCSLICLYDYLKYR